MPCLDLPTVRHQQDDKSRCVGVSRVDATSVNLMTVTAWAITVNSIPEDIGAVVVKLQAIQVKPATVHLPSAILIRRELLSN